MPIPFLNSINLTKNQVENFCVYNLGSDPTGSLTAAGDLGYFWLNTAGQKTLKWWDGTNIRSIIDSTNIGSFTSGLATDLAGGAGGDLPYQAGTNDTTFLPLGTAGQVLAVKSTLTQPEWINQSSITAGAVANALTAGTYLTSGGTYNGSAARTFAVDATDANTASKVVARDGSGNFSAGTITANLTGTASSATNKTGGNLGDILVQSGSGTTSFLNAGTAGQVITSNGASPQYVNQSTLSVGSASKATDVAGGSAGKLLYQTAVDDTDFLAVGTNGQVLTSSGSAPQWSNQSSLSVGSATTAGSVTNALTAGSYLTSTGTFDGSVARTFAVDATDANTASKVVARDASGNFSAGTITATRVTGLTAPSAGSDAANRDYVDSVAQGLDIKASCLVATTGDITLSSPGAISIDNIPSTSFTSGATRILVRAQNTASQNGIYIWNGSGSAMTRSADADTWDELVSAFTFIEQGDTLKDTGWVCTVDAGTLGTTAVTWSQFSGAGSYTANRGLVLSGTAFNFAQNSDYTVGDLPYATGQTTIGLLPDVATGNALISGGVATAPSWGKIGLTTHVSGTLPIANGGTGATNFTQGQVLFAGASAISSSANLFWDNSNNRLGIGTATPATIFHVSGGPSYFTNGSGSAADIEIAGNNNTAGTGSLLIRQSASNEAMVWNRASAALTLGTASVEKFRIASDGVCTWSNVGGVVSNAMVLNGTGLGVGASPSAAIHSAKAAAANPTGGSAAGAGLYVSNVNPLYGMMFGVNGGGVGWIQQQRSDTNTQYDLSLQPLGGNVGIGTTTPIPYAANARVLHIDGGANSSEIRLTNNTTGTANTDGGLLTMSGSNLYVWNNENASVIFGTNNGTKATLDSAGNLGLGVTPKTWGSAYKAIQVNTTGAVTSYSGAVILGNNYYANSSGNPAYITAAAAGAYAIVGKAHTWYRSTDATPVADGACTLDPAMTLFADGNLAIGTASNNGGVCVEDRYILVRSNNAKQFLRLGTDGSNDIYLSGTELLGITGAAGIRFSAGAGLPERLSIKSTGQVNFVGQSSDPAGAAGDLYYNSGSNVFKVYDTGWKTLPRKYSTALAGTSTTFDVTHNLGTQDVTVMVRKSASTFDVVYTDIQVATTNKVTIVFASSVTGSDYTVTVIG